MIQRQLELATPSSIAAALSLGREPETDLPQQLAPGESETITAADPHERFDCRSFERRWSTSNEIPDAIERSVPLSLFRGRGRCFFAPVPHETQADSYCSVFRAPCSLFDRAPDVAAIDVRQAQINAIAERVTAQGIDRVKAHRLVVEERDVILDGMIVPQPRRLVREQAKCRGV